LKLGDAAPLHAGDCLIVLRPCAHRLDLRGLSQLRWDIHAVNSLRLLVLADTHHLPNRSKSRAIYEDAIEGLDSGVSILGSKLGHRVLWIDSPQGFTLDACKWRQITTIGQQFILGPGGAYPGRIPGC
jgi:hypothetical protein